MAKTFDFNAIKGIKLVDKSGKVKDEAVKSKLGNQNLFRFKDGIVWAKPFKLYLPTIPDSPSSVKIKINRPTTKRSLATTGQIFYIDTASHVQTTNELNIYYEDTLTITGKTTTDFYKDPIVSLSEYTVTGDVYATIEAGERVSYKLTMSPTPAVGVNNYTITRTDGWRYGNSETFTSSNVQQEHKIYHRDKLSYSVNYKRGYRNATMGINSVGSVNDLSSVTRDYSFVLADALLVTKAFRVNTLPAGVDKIIVFRDDSPIANATLGEVATITKDDTDYGKATAYIDDEFSYTWVTTEGYYEPTFSLQSPIKIDENTSDTIWLKATSGGVKQFALEIPSLPTGVESVTVTRTSSPLANASKGELSDGATIYYGDTLTVTATPEIGYNNPRIEETSITVKDDVQVKVYGTGVKTYTLTMPAIPTGVQNYGVIREGTLQQGSQNFGATTSQQKFTIYHGDNLTIDGIPVYGYEMLFSTTGGSGGSRQLFVENISSDITVTVIVNDNHLVWLTVPALPEGITSCKLEVTQTQYGETGQTWYLSDKEQRIAVFYYDSITVTPTVKAGYDTPQIGKIGSDNIYYEQNPISIGLSDVTLVVAVPKWNKVGSVNYTFTAKNVGSTESAGFVYETSSGEIPLGGYVQGLKTRLTGSVRVSTTPNTMYDEYATISGGWTVALNYDKTTSFEKTEIDLGDSSYYLIRASDHCVYVSGITINGKPLTGTFYVDVYMFFYNDRIQLQVDPRKTDGINNAAPDIRIDFNLTSIEQYY